MLRPFAGRGFFIYPIIRLIRGLIPIEINASVFSGSVSN